MLTENLVKDGETVHAISYEYDDNGNLISRTKLADGVSETTTYTWNDDNRLVSVETPDGTLITYEYDDERIRVSSTVNGETTDYLIDKNQPYAQVLEELKSGDLEAFYVYGHDLISQTREGEQDVYHVDGLGSTRALTDENGNVTDSYNYEAFGELTNSEGESENSYLFAGEQFDEELEDYYLRQRFYDQSSGRFVRRDTYEGIISNPLTLHKYLYTHANPISYIDPTGLFTMAEISAANVIRDELMKGQLVKGVDIIRSIGGLEGGQKIANLLESAAALLDVVELITVIGAIGPEILNWSFNSVKTFGHSFSVHGAGLKRTKALTGRAASTGKPQGQWLNNEAAAEFLESQHIGISGPASIMIPEGLGQVIKPDGSIVSAKWAAVVPKRGGGYRTAYPILND